MEKVKQNKLLRKDISNLTEMYYTKPEIVEKICNVAREKIGITETDLIIEPSAGNGAFVDHIKSLCAKTKPSTSFDHQSSHGRGGLGIVSWGWRNHRYHDKCIKQSIN